MVPLRTRAVFEQISLNLESDFPAIQGSKAVWNGPLLSQYSKSENLI